ncbi:MAG: hypothetical protein ACPG4X_16925 [Pikeienuella sp.]
MKLIVATALAALLAWPAWAQVVAVPLTIHCTRDWRVFEKVYGDLVPIEGPIRNSDGFGFLLAGNDNVKVVFFTAPDGAICVAWDNYVPDGDPA